MQNTNTQKKTYCPNGWAKIDTRIEEDPKLLHASNQLKNRYKTYFQELQIEVGYLAMVWTKYIAYSKSRQTNISFRNLPKELLLTFQTYYKLTKEQLKIINRVFCEVKLFDKIYRIANYFKWNEKDLKDEKDATATTSQPPATTSQQSKKRHRNPIYYCIYRLRKKQATKGLSREELTRLQTLQQQCNHPQPSANTPHRVIETLELKKEEKPIIKKSNLVYKDSYIPYVKEENPRSADFRENDFKSVSSILKTHSTLKQYNYTNDGNDNNSTPTENENRGVFCSVA